MKEEQNYNFSDKTMVELMAKSCHWLRAITHLRSSKEFFQTILF